MLLELGLAVGGGILNAVAGAEQDREMEKRKQRSLSLLRENIVDPDELDDMLSGINQMFNSRLVSTLNSTALRSRGVANSGVVKGVTAGQIEGQRLGTLSDTRFRVQESNNNTRTQMANVESSIGSSNSVVGDFFAGGLTALPAAMEAGKMLNPSVSTTLASAGTPNVKSTSPTNITSPIGIPSYNEGNIMEGLGTFSKLYGRGF